MSFKVLAHRIGVKPFDVNEWDDTRKKARALGLALPDEDPRAKASVDMGTVVQIGSTAVTEVALGDTVAYVKNAGKFVQHPTTKEEIYILNDEDLLVVFHQETADV